jgi:hypothetical protein
VADFFKQDNELSGSINGWRFLDREKLRKKDSALWLVY